MQQSNRPRHKRQHIKQTLGKMIWPSHAKPSSKAVMWEKKIEMRQNLWQHDLAKPSGRAITWQTNKNK